MKLSLTSQVLSSSYLDVGIVETTDGKLWKALKFEPLESGNLEENFDGERSSGFFNKVSELFSRLPDYTELHIILSRE